jgi:hypothetical protein
MMPKEESGVSDPTTDRGPNEQKPGPWGALLTVITEPTATFRALAERPALLPPYLLQTVAGLIGVYLLLPLTKAGVAEQLIKTPPPPGMTPQLYQMIGIGAALFGALAGPWMIGAILALIASFFAQFQGGSAGFRPYLSMIGYARVPLAVGGLIQALLMTRATSMQQAQTMSLSLAALAPDETHFVLKALLSTINPFDVFYYALLAIGFGAVQRMRPARSATFVGVIYVLALGLMLVGGAVNKSRGM